MKIGLRELLFFIVMLGVLGSSYFLIFSKANERRKAWEADTLVKQRALADLTAATTGLTDLNRKIDDLESAIQFFNNKLPQRREVDTILQQVSQISQACGLATRTVRPDRSQTTANFSEEPISLILTGDFTGFYQFMLDLEKLPRLTRVTQMKLTKLDSHEGQMTAEVTLSIYFAPDVGATASAQ
jgi:type IV pilus assembly protein PilO